MAKTRRLERLNAADLYVLMWDDFGWSGDIGVLAILDGTRLVDHHGHLRIGMVRRHIQSRLHLVPRFRQLLYRPRLGLGWPVWVDAPAFDLADHVRVRPLAVSADRARLVQVCEQLAQRRLDPSRPLWELWLLPGLPEQRVGLFLKLHHAVADGVAGVAAFGALPDLAADAVTPSPRRGRRRPCQVSVNSCVTTCHGASRGGITPGRAWPTRAGRWRVCGTAGQPGGSSSPSSVPP